MEGAIRARISCDIQTLIRLHMSLFLFSWYSCCVDEIAAEHVSSDAIIHFGPSCLSM